MIRWLRAVGVREVSSVWGTLAACVGFELVWMVVTLGRIPGPMYILFSALDKTRSLPHPSVLYYVMHFAVGVLLVWVVARERRWRLLAILTVALPLWYWGEMLFLLGTLGPGS